MLATNFWVASKSSKIITDAMRELSRRAEKRGRKVVFKLIYDRGNPKQVIENHIVVPEKEVRTLIRSFVWIIVELTLIRCVWNKVHGRRSENTCFLRSAGISPGGGQLSPTRCRYLPCQGQLTFPLASAYNAT